MTRIHLTLFSCWGFPKGKINKDEPELNCAIREVFEEIGYDCSKLIRPNEYIERKSGEQRQRLYIVCGVPNSQKFETQTRGEIGDIQWIELSKIPGWNCVEDGPDSTNETPKKRKFYMVTPFIAQLQRWIRRYKKAKKQGKLKTANLKVVEATESEGVSDYSILPKKTAEAISKSMKKRNSIETGPKNIDESSQTNISLENSIKNILGLGNSFSSLHIEQSIFRFSYTLRASKYYSRNSFRK